MIFEIIGLLGVICAGVIALLLPLLLALTVSFGWLALYLVYGLIILIMACMYASARGDEMNKKNSEDDGNDET